MSEQSLKALNRRPAFRTILFFFIVLCAATILIMLGRRNDAVTQAQLYQAGVLTADEINVAFDKVGGRLIKRTVNESDYVKKGDLLMELSSEDLNYSIQNLQAQLDAAEAEIRHQELNIQNSLDKLKTEEIKTWRQIEQQNAQLDATEATLEQAEAEYKRYSALSETSAVSKSAYDNAKATYLTARASHTQLIRSLQELTLGATEAQIKKLSETGSAEGMTLASITQERTDIENLYNTLASQKANRDAISAQLGLERLNLVHTCLYAPADAKVLEVMYEEGEMVPTSAAGVLLETKRYYYDVYFSEKSAPRYKAGDRVRGYVPALDDYVEGTVRFVQVAPSFADLRMSREQGKADLTSFKMRIYTDPMDNLLPGMTVELENEDR